MDTLQLSASSPRWLQMGWGLETHLWPTGPNLTLRLAYSIIDSQSLNNHIFLLLVVNIGKSLLNDDLSPRWALKEPKGVFSWKRQTPEHSVCVCMCVCVCPRAQTEMMTAFPSSWNEIFAKTFFNVLKPALFMCLTDCINHGRNSCDYGFEASCLHFGRRHLGFFGAKSDRICEAEQTLSYQLMLVLARYLG